MWSNTGFDAGAGRAGEAAPFEIARLVIRPASPASLSPALASPALASPADDRPEDGAAPGPAEKAEEKPPRHVVIVAVGDTGFGANLAPVLAGGGYKHGSFQSYEQALSMIADEIDGDVNFANLETVVTTQNDLVPVAKAYNFRTHPDAVRYLADIGFNLFSTANNHAFDYGARGILETVRNLEALADTRGRDFIFAGIGRNIEEAAAAKTLDITGARIAFGAIGIGAWSGGAAQASENRPGQLAIADGGDVRRLLANLDAARADYRILSVHTGKERLAAPLAREIALWRDKVLADGDVDMILAHHTHVARPVAMVGNRVIFFGLGNFAHFGTADMNHAGICLDYSIIARTHLVDDADGHLAVAAIEIVPIHSTHMRPERLKPAQARRRIAVLNSLASTVDDPQHGATGIRFSPRDDGTGLYCTELGRDASSPVADLCRGYDRDLAATLEDEVPGATRCCRSLACMNGSTTKARLISTRKKASKHGSWFEPLPGLHMPRWIKRHR